MSNFLFYLLAVGLPALATVGAFMLISHSLRERRRGQRERLQAQMRGRREEGRRQPH